MLLKEQKVGGAEVLPPGEERALQGAGLVTCLSLTELQGWARSVHAQRFEALLGYKHRVESYIPRPFILQLEKVLTLLLNAVVTPQGFQNPTQKPEGVYEAHLQGHSWKRD